jgi:hypothetical protein
VCVTCQIYSFPSFTGKTDLTVGEPAGDLVGVTVATGTGGQNGLGTVGFGVLGHVGLRVFLVGFSGQTGLGGQVGNSVGASGQKGMSVGG